jgi:hypothetical protein
VLSYACNRQAFVSPIVCMVTAKLSLFFHKLVSISILVRLMVERISILFSYAWKLPNVNDCFPPFS